MGSVYARVAFGIAAPRVGLLSIGEEATKGNELTREAHRLLKAAAVSFIGNVEARDVYSGHADVIVCDGFTGNVALKISEGLVEMVEELSCREPSRCGGSLTRVPSAFPPSRRLLGIRRRAAARRRRRHHRRPRPIERQGRAQRRRHGLPVRRQPLHRARRAGDRRRRDLLVIAFIFPGQGSQKVGMGKALAEAFPICRETFDEADAALGEPLSRDLLRGPRRPAHADREHAAGDSRGQHRRVPAAGVARACAGVRGRPQPRRVLGERGRRDVRIRRCAADRAAPRPLHAGSGAGRHRRDGGDPRPRRGEGRAGVPRARRKATSSARRT